MSRLRALHVPFVQGHDDRVDAKVLPDGALADVRNGRLRKAGSLALRRGWRPLDMDVCTDDGSNLSAVTVQDLYSYDRSLVALYKRSGVLGLMAFTNSQTTRPWTTRTGQPVPPLTRVRTVGNVPDLSADVIRGSAAVTSDGLYGAVLLQTSARSVLRVFVMATDETLFYDDYSSATNSDPRKVVSLGTTFGIVVNTGAALRLQTYSPTAVGSGLSSNTTLVTAVVTHFDVATAGETTPTALHVTYTVGGEVSYAQFTFAGSQTGSTKQVLAAGGRSSYIASDDVTAHVVYQASATGELSLLSFAATGAYTTAAGPTALDAGVDIRDDSYAIGYAPTTGTVWVAGTLETTNANVYSTPGATHSAVTKVEHRACTVSSGWLVHEGVAGVVMTRGTDGDQAGQDIIVVDNTSVWTVPAFRLGIKPPTGGSPYGVGTSPSADYLVPYLRTSEAAKITSLGSGAIRSRQAGVFTCRVLDTARRPGVTFGGALYLSGGVLTQYTGGGPAENGILRPVISTLAQSNSTGTIANGIYSYRAIVTWRDEGGRRHLSVVSDAVTITVAGANDTVTATLFIPKTLRRDPNLVSDPVVELYRTEAGPGELFYLVASATVDTDDSTDVVDTTPDADIVDNRRLYTEGEFGAVSGVLDVTPPDASAYVAAMRDRLVLGSAGASYQVSQIALPEEPVCFTQPGVSGPIALAYFDAVEGPLTGLATLDDTIVAGTSTRLYVAGGEGPNLAGVGEFQSPARLPTDVGFYAANSIVEDENGLWFLGDADKLYLLPRGQGAPTFAGKSVQDRFAAAVVGAGRDTEDGVTAWAVADATLVLRHSGEGQWLGDSLPFTPAAFISHQGRFYAVDSVGAVWAQDASAYGDGTSGGTAVALRVVTGDVAVFGLAGHGRLACVELLGEFQSAAAILAEISYDLGQTWTSLGTHTVTGLSAGQAFQRQWYPARQRGGKFRLRFTMTPSVTTAEGCRLTGFSVYFDQRSGPTRLDSAKRR